MNILVIGSDPRIFERSSENFSRVREYAAFFGQYHIVSSAPAGEKPHHRDNLFLYPAHSRIPFFWLWRAYVIGRKVARQHRIDVVDAQDAGECGLAAFFIARGAGLAFRLQIHADIMSPRYRRASWKEYARWRIARFLIPRASCIRAVSQRIRRSLVAAEQIPQIQFGGRSAKLSLDQKITVLPIFTDVSSFLNAAPDPAAEERFKNYDFKMIAAGRFMDKEKNFSMLIDVMRIFTRICPQALLVMVGEGLDREHYKLQTTNYKLKENIILEPWRRDLPSFYRSFDLFLSPSNYEGWGRAVVEAMAAGLPVVMTDVGLAGEVVRNGENGMVVSVGDAQAFLRAIQMLYTDPEKRKSLAAAGRQTAENLKPATRAEYLARYRECLESCAYAPAQ